MSLIEEALRRIRDPALTPTPAPTPPAGPGAVRSQEPTPAHPWPLTPATQRHGDRTTWPLVISPLALIALAVSILAVGLIAGGGFWLGRTATGPRAATAVATDSLDSAPTMADSVAGNPAAPAAPAVAASKPQEPFVLTGVVEGTGEPYAMINGMIVGVGERVGDAVLLSITNGTVRIRRANGQERVLRVAR